MCWFQGDTTNLKLWQPKWQPNVIAFNPVSAIAKTWEKQKDFLYLPFPLTLLASHCLHHFIWNHSEIPAKLRKIWAHKESQHFFVRSWKSCKLKFRPSQLEVNLVGPDSFSVVLKLCSCTNTVMATQLREWVSGSKLYSMDSGVVVATSDWCCWAVKMWLINFPSFVFPSITIGKAKVGTLVRPHDYSA